MPQKPQPVPPDDKAYADAAPRAMARAFAQLYLGLVAEGVPEHRAAEWVQTYVGVLAARPTMDDDDQDAEP